ncbi:MAG TPA: DUF1501 domain-containing protein [Planctomycetes bacterium]|nr:DUF1501 domain-containing protein [Planctomycetaceae bacterium]HIM30260.1 DUF1501 domain-containing protein [Planctomycetota bacterium]
MNRNPLTSRREMLSRSACGFGSLALAGLCHQNRVTAAPSTDSAVDKSKSNRPHFAPRAKRVIFIFMQGGPSHVDTFDYKPALAQLDGKSQEFADDRVKAKTGMKVSSHKLMKSPWSFRQYGDSGRWVSELFPNMAQQVDQMCMVHSMHTEGVAHGPATLFLHCGATNLVRPSIGSWVTYGLGSESENLPGFVAISPSAGNGGPRNYGNAFLPAMYQGTAIGTPSSKEIKLKDISNQRYSSEQQQRQLSLTRSLNQAQLLQAGGEEEFEAVIRSFELGWRMQQHAPAITTVDDEPQHVLDMYGVGKKETDRFGRQCLVARRMCEAGVRYIQVNYGDNSANPAWDQHSNLPKHADHAKRVDQPIAALLADLKQRGLLEDTLVWWGAEFGRTPYAQNNGTGRDHNPSGFTMWLAGAGVQAGLSYGKTDTFGHEAVENKVHMHDLHATILHLLGIDHERLTFPYAGRNFRLTDVHGTVVEKILV